MTWAKRVFNFLKEAPRELSARDLEIKYEVPKPRTVLANLRRQGCIEESFRLGGERFWRIKPGAPEPQDLRIENARQKTHIALRARQLKQSLER